MRLTARQKKALLDADQSGGQIFQLPESRRHGPMVLSNLVKLGLLKSESVGVIWTLTDEGRRQLTLARAAVPQALSDAAHDVPAAAARHPGET